MKVYAATFAVILRFLVAIFPSYVWGRESLDAARNNRGMR